MSKDWFLHWRRYGRNALEHCDWKGKCKRAPYAEIYPVECDKDGEWGWYYLCFWHFYLARIYSFFGLRREFGWGDADTSEDD